MPNAARPAPPATLPPRGDGWPATLALGAAALALFLLLPQRLLHGVDGNTFSVWIDAGFRGYARHIAYLHFCGLVHELVGGSGFLALQIASAIGAAVGLGCVHRTFALLPHGGQRSALLPAIAVAFTPAWFLYATTGEVHGVFAAGAGASWWAFARWLRAPTVPRAVVLGAATAAAASLHAFGHLLPPCFVLLALVFRRLSGPARLPQLVAFAAAHGLLALAASALLGAGAGDQTQDALGHLEERWATFAPATAPAVFLREWLLPFLPWSFAAFVAFLGVRARPWALATVLLLAVHLPFTVLLLGFIEADESGGYLLAVAPAAVLAAAHLVPPRTFASWVAASTLLAALLAAPGFCEPISPGFQAGYAELHRERHPALLVANPAELSGARAATPGTLVLQLSEVIGAFMQTRGPDQTFAPWFDGWCGKLTAEGLPVLLTEAAHEFFASGPDLGLRLFWRDHVLQRYRVEAVQRQDFRGVWLTPK
ncbi:MAG: hypothetical protein FJ265_09110 [Planctomycetes bacterium]|nr:hypothetical protein [Planctomycetota bacterium]